MRRGITRAERPASRRGSRRTCAGVNLAGGTRAEIATTVNVRTIKSLPRTSRRAQRGARMRPVAAHRSRHDPRGLRWIWRRHQRGAISPGDRTRSQIITFQDPGSFQFCGWLYQDAGTFGTDVLIASTSGTFTVASPVGAITGVAVPLSVVQGRPFVVDVSGQAEVTRRLYTAWRPASEPRCAASPSLDPDSASYQSSDPSSQGDVLGNFSQRIRVSIATPGRYRFCSWIVRDSSDLSPLGLNESLITVVSTQYAAAVRRLLSPKATSLAGPTKLVVRLDEADRLAEVPRRASPGRPRSCPRRCERQDRWTKRTGSQRYRVELRGAAASWFATTVSGRSVTIPAQRVGALGGYELIIRAGKGAAPRAFYAPPWARGAFTRG